MPKMAVMCISEPLVATLPKVMAVSAVDSMTVVGLVSAVGSATVVNSGSAFESVTVVDSVSDAASCVRPADSIAR